MVWLVIVNHPCEPPYTTRDENKHDREPPSCARFISRLRVLSALAYDSYINQPRTADAVIVLFLSRFFSL